LLCIGLAHCNNYKQETRRLFGLSFGTRKTIITTGGLYRALVTIYVT